MKRLFSGEACVLYQLRYSTQMTQIMKRWSQIRTLFSDLANISSKSAC
ncbi:MAG: hypothetical protein LBJ00_16435 [Planctomycetaceae bacterium]|nr:hypothetical protein [Planctomycetaceae bacterium]